MNKISRVLALLSLFTVMTAVSAGGEYPEEEGVLVLGDNNLAEALAEFEYVLVEFYAPWCGHCKKLAPEYAKAATVLKAEGSPARLAKVDTTVEKASGEKYQIKGYPTLKFFVKGQQQDYEGGRTESEILTWIRKKTLPSVLEVNTSEELAKHIKNHDVLAVLFGGKDHEDYSHFEGVSKHFDDVGFVHTHNADLRAEHNVPEGTHVLLLKKFDELRHELAGKFNFDKLKDWIHGHKTPLVLPFDQKAAQKIFGENVPTLFLLHDKNEAGTKAENILKEVAGKLKGKIQASISHIKDGGLGPRLAEYVGVKDADVPAFRIVVPSKSGNPKKYVYEGEATVEGLQKFHDDYAAGTLSPHFKSDPIPENNDGPVKTIVGKNFNDIVLDPTKDVFIEFYAPWCGHCKKLTPIWEELGTQLAGIKDLVIAKMDSTANEVDSVSVSGFPTLKFYPANNKKNPINYDSDRTKEGFLKWLKTKVTVEHSPSAFDGPAGSGEL